MITTSEELRSRLAEIKDNEAVRVRFTHNRNGKLHNENIIVKRYNGSLYRKKKITSRTLYNLYLNHYFTDELVSVKIIDPKVKRSQPTNFRREAAKAVKRIHPNLWSDFKQEFQDFIDGKTERVPSVLENNGKSKFRDISKIFPSYVMVQLKTAIETKTDYSYMLHGSKRDRSVSVSTAPDGITRAWFSSEYSGCGNGDYYLLLNPTTAIFGETD
jgi:uncharacterized FAD-dependent dehydrogenase